MYMYIRKCYKNEEFSPLTVHQIKNETQLLWSLKSIIKINNKRTVHLIMDQSINNNQLIIITLASIFLSFRASSSPLFTLILFLSSSFIANLTSNNTYMTRIKGLCYIFPESSFLQPNTSPKPPLPMIR